MSVFCDMSSLWKMLPFQGPGDQSCSAPFCLARQLWLSRTGDLEHRCQVNKMSNKLSMLNLIWYQRKVHWNVNGTTGTSCSVCSTTWTMRTRWHSEGCKPWTHLVFLSWWKTWAQWASARFTVDTFSFCFKTFLKPTLFHCSFFDQNLLYLVWQEPLLSRLPNYCKIKDKLPPMDKVMRLMHLARYHPEDPSWNPCPDDRHQ